MLRSLIFIPRHSLDACQHCVYRSATCSKFAILSRLSDITLFIWYTSTRLFFKIAHYLPRVLWVTSSFQVCSGGWIRTNIVNFLDTFCISSLPLPHFQ